MKIESNILFLIKKLCSCSRFQIVYLSFILQLEKRWKLTYDFFLNSKLSMIIICTQFLLKYIVFNQKLSWKHLLFCLKLKLWFEAFNEARNKEETPKKWNTSPRFYKWMILAFIILTCDFSFPQKVLPSLQIFQLQILLMDKYDSGSWTETFIICVRFQSVDSHQILLSYQPTILFHIGLFIYVS